MWVNIPYIDGYGVIIQWTPVFHSRPRGRPPPKKKNPPNSAEQKKNPPNSGNQAAVNAKAEICSRALGSAFNKWTIQGPP